MALELPIFNIHIDDYHMQEIQIHNKLESYKSLLGILIDSSNKQYVCDVIKAWIYRMLQHHTTFDASCKYAEYHCIERYAQYIVQMTLCLNVE